MSLKSESDGLFWEWGIDARREKCYNVSNKPLVIFGWGLEYL